MNKPWTTTCLFVATTVAIAVFNNSAAFGQEKKTADLGLSSPDSLTARVDRLFAEWGTPGSPGCVLGVIRDGKLIYARGYGLANLEYNLPLTPKSVLNIASVSKQFTAASILLLAQRGALSLDDDIRKYVPEIPAYNAEPITIRHLLNHTSGIRDWYDLMNLASPIGDLSVGRPIEDADMLAVIARQKETNFPPGSEYSYSNSGYSLLSVIVKRTSGKTLREFAEANIFAPLGMSHTHFHDDYGMVVPLRAPGYGARNNGFRKAPEINDPPGPTGLYTSVEDLLLWDQNFYHKKVGGQALQDELHRVGVLTSGEKLDHGSGLVLSEYRGLGTVSFDGAWTGYRSFLLRFPQQSFSVVCLCNVSSARPGRVSYRVADEYLGELMTALPERGAVPAGVVLTEAELKQRAGIYRNVRTQEVRRIDLTDGTLVVGARKLTAMDANRFIGSTTLPPYEVTFQSVGAAPGVRMVEKAGGGKPTTYERMQASTLSVGELAAYAGNYYSEELDAVYEIAADKDLLSVTVRPGRAPLFMARPTYRDAFMNSVGLMPQFVFERDAGGRVFAFRFQLGSVRSIRFVRQPR